MQVTLKCLEGKPQTVVIDSPEFLIGRGGDCDLRLASPLVSRHHCAVTVHNGRVCVRDLQSRNGTGLNNGSLLGEQSLSDGDTLWVAGTAVQVRIVDLRSSKAAVMNGGKCFAREQPSTAALTGARFTEEPFRQAAVSREPLTHDSLTHGSVQA